MKQNLVFWAVVAGCAGGLVLIGAGYQYNAVALGTCGLIIGAICGVYFQLRARLRGFGDLVIDGVFIGTGMALAAGVETLFLILKNGSVGNLWGLGISLTLLFGLPGAILGTSVAGWASRKLSNR